MVSSACPNSIVPNPTAVEVEAVKFVAVAALPVVLWFNVGIFVLCIVPALAPAQSTCSAARKLVNAS